MMREVCVHENDEVTGTVRKSVNVGTAQAKFARACVQLELIAIDLLQLTDDVLRTVR